MKYEISIDGGGTKLQAILFDENYRFISSARSGSANLYSSSEAKIKKNVDDCLTQLFATEKPDAIDCVYSAYAGAEPAPTRMNGFLQKKMKIREVRNIGEARMGLYAAGASGTGILALAGTGSDIFYLRDGKPTDVVGGWGALISDEGSGYYLGRLAANAAIYDYEGRGPHTLLSRLIPQMMNQPDIHAALIAVYQTPHITTQISRFSHAVSDAAKAGDKVANDILDCSAQLMADQTAALVRRNPDAAGMPIYIAGGAWKTWSYLERFRLAVQKSIPDSEVCIPLFEPVMGGVIASVFRKYGELSQKMLLHLEKEFDLFRYRL